MGIPCPNCGAPLIHYNNSDRSITDYCEYCRYRFDHPAPQETVSDKVTNMVGNFVGDLFGTNILPEKKLSKIELMDQERALEEMKSKMTDKERRKFEKRQKASERSARVFDPKTGTYR